MEVNSVPTVGWTRGGVAATIRLVTQEQRNDIAARVRAEMERQGLSSVRLARKAEVSDKTISRVINAKRDSRYDTLERIANALGVTESDLRGPPPAPLGLGRTPDPFSNGSSDLSEIKELLSAMQAEQLERVTVVLEQLDDIKHSIEELQALRRRQPA